MGDLTEADTRPGGRDDRLLAWPAVRDITGLSRTTAWRMQKTGDFPLPVVVSPGRVCWWESELAAWKIARAPRRPPEMRLFEASPDPERQGANRPVDPASKAVATTTQAGEQVQASSASVGRRGSRTSPGQIAFDFGS
ncbi:MAG: AlpA family phage regulatory protein [Brevundimonas sp.]|uniref:helix-turn-helix transcriptional regulator n=1 Tax=Brevundimonas sp. TaxID=1871086 RepID=UPI002489E8D2|nr:AlpA family phage regulatory protein [Brevundimonas sp.]MDI1328276.1 AlpA family phage regulatory protein [Brevundimonas sp.]